MPIVERSGSGAERAVLLVHGTPGDRRVFAPLLALASPDVLVVHHELPDHGTAPTDPAAGWQAVEADLLASLSDLRGAPSLTLVGHSLGAFLLGRLLEVAGSDVKHAVLISGFARLPADVARARVEIADALEAGALSTEVLAGFVSQAFFGSSPRRHEDVSLVESIITSAQRSRLARGFRRLGSLTPLEVSRFDTPATVVHGSRDQAVPFSLGLELAERGSRTRVIAIDTDAHAPQLTHPAAIWSLVAGPPPR